MYDVRKFAQLHFSVHDHCVLQFDCQLQAIDRQYQNKFRLDKGDYEHLCDIDWDTFLDYRYAHSSIDEMWDKFEVLITKGINKFIPKAGQHRPNAKQKIFSLSLKTFNSWYIRNTSYGNAGLLARMKQYTGNTKLFTIK